jgi:hypothetical protein
MKGLLLILLVSFSLFSCTKNNNSSDICNVSFTNIIGTYKKTAVTFQYNPQSQIQDIYSSWPPCKQDDIWVLNSDSTVNFVDQISCTPPANGYAYRKWGFENNTIFFKDATNNYLEGFKIFDFNCNKIIGQQIDLQGSVTTTIFTRQ